MNLNAYYTRWIDKSMTKQGSIKAPYYINMAGVNSKLYLAVSLLTITPRAQPKLNNAVVNSYHHAPWHEPWPLACGRVFPKKKQPSSAEITEPSSTPSLAWLSMASPLAPRPA